MKSALRFTTAVSLALAAAFPALCQTPQPWTPSRTIEFISSTGVGGAQDRLARSVQGIAQAAKVLPVPMIVVNKPGGSGAISVSYLNRTPGDGHSLLVASALMLSSHIMGRASFNYTDMTPVAQLFHEYPVLVVRNESPIRTGAEYMSRIRAAAESISIGVSALGTPHHISISLAARSAGIDPKRLKMVTFKAGSDAIVATLGGHIDATVSSASNVLSGMESGTIRAIAVASPQRLPGPMANVPTWKEMGVDAVASNFRMVFGPRGLSESQIAYWEQVLARVSETPSWTKEVESNAWVPGYQNSAQSKQILATEYDKLKVVLSELGMARQ